MIINNTQIFGAIMIILLVSSCAVEPNRVDYFSDFPNIDFNTESDSVCDPSAIFLTKAETSSAIGTVGIIEWSTTISPLMSASIEFGLDENYEYVAPVDLNEPNYRTLLLGMKPNKLYHYRIVVNGCKGNDLMLETGEHPTNLPNKKLSVNNSELSAEGFIVTSTGMRLNYAYILDKDGDYVWWYPFSSAESGGRMDGIGRARLSVDGKYMWAATINVGCGCGYLYRIGMDGLGVQETIAVNLHHDFTVLPDGSVAYIEYTDNGDKIVERMESGDTRTVYNLSDDFYGEGINWSHCNSIHYYPGDDSYTLSCLNLNNIIKIDRAQGTLIWNLEGYSQGDFRGVMWNRQHGHQLLDNGNIVFFSNEGENLSDETDVFDLESSEAIELSLDYEAKESKKVWSYKGGAISIALGDVQRLSNGNTLITYSAAGVIHEITSNNILVRDISVNGLGYANWRPTLYGVPYRY